MSPNNTEIGMNATPKRVTLGETMAMFNARNNNNNNGLVEDDDDDDEIGEQYDRLYDLGGELRPLVTGRAQSSAVAPAAGAGAGVGVAGGPVPMGAAPVGRAAGLVPSTMTTKTSSRPLTQAAANRAKFAIKSYTIAVSILVRAPNSWPTSWGTVSGEPVRRLGRFLANWLLVFGPWAVQLRVKVPARVSVSVVCLTCNYTT